MASDTDEGPKLSEKFDNGLKLLGQLEESYEATNSDPFQVKVRKAVKLLEEATNMVSMLGVFSSNEEIEEVATTDIKYFLLPALLGNLTMKLNTNVDNRLHVVEVAEIYYKDFLHRCKDYNVPGVVIPEEPPLVDTSNVSPSGIPPGLLALAARRQEKIIRFNEQKEHEKKLRELQQLVDQETVDDEVRRDYYLALLKKWIDLAVDELSSIQAEKPILIHMAKIKSEQDNVPEKHITPRKPLKPVIITRDQLQKKIYGAGYPSIPTMTVNEFYEEKIREGTFALANPNQKSLLDKTIAGQSRREEEERYLEAKEKAVEDDDTLLLKTTRDMDEFKDDHRRGWGNRKNMG